MEVALGQARHQASKSIRKSSSLQFKKALALKSSNKSEYSTKIDIWIKQENL